jgi:phosphatidylglycerol---prolipoprotein diacylglyceryl transferase
MRPVLITWRGLTIYSYPAFLYLGLVVGVAAGNYAAHRAGVDAGEVFVATLLLLIPALAGARFLHVVSHWRVYRAAPGRIWNRAEGGAAMYGGLLLAVPLSIPLLAGLGLRFGAFWDVTTFTLLVGMAFARIGCLLNGCCAGRPSSASVALWLPDCGGVWERRLPTQLLELAWGLVLLAGAVVLWPMAPFGGSLFLYALGGYGVGRLLLESTRDRRDRVAGMSLHHAISLLLVAIAATGWAVG